MYLLLQFLCLFALLQGIGSLPVGKIGRNIALVALSSLAIGNSFTPSKTPYTSRLTNDDPSIPQFALHYRNLDGDLDDSDRVDFELNSPPLDTGFMSQRGELQGIHKEWQEARKLSKKARADLMMTPEYIEKKYFSIRFSNLTDVYPLSYPDANILVFLANNINSRFTPRKGPNKILTPGILYSNSHQA
jgi:hypothetical protein